MSCRSVARWSIVSTLFLGLNLTGFASWSQLPPPPLESVFGIERSNELDRVILRNGTEMWGSVLNEQFSIATSYGRVTLPVTRVAGIDLHPNPNAIAAIHTVNGNRFTGFLDHPTVRVHLSTGAATELRREAIATIVMATRSDERAGLSAGRLLFLDNGDVLTGSVAPGGLTVASNGGTVSLQLDEIDTLVFQLFEETMVLGTANLADGRQVQGVVTPMVFDLQLDVGGALSVYQGRIHTLFAAAGTRPESLGLVAVSREYEGELTGDDAVTPDGKFYDEYTFYALEGSHIVVDMTVDTFDNFTVLLSPSGQEWRNDDFGSTRRSRIEAVADASGQWRARATSLSAGQLGTYQLQIAVE